MTKGIMKTKKLIKMREQFSLLDIHFMRHGHCLSLYIYGTIPSVQPQTANYNKLQGVRKIWLEKKFGWRKNLAKYQKFGEVPEIW